MTSAFFLEYKKSIREFRLEEPFDFIIFRPLAFILVKLTWHFPLRPDHFSFLGLLAALVSGLCLSQGSADGFVFGGLGIFLFSVLDCCDGMLARMKSSGSTYGDLIDMFVDLLSSTSIYVGLFLGLRREDGYFPIEYLSLVSGVSLLIHASFYNFYKEQFFNYLSANPNGRIRKVEKFRRDLAAMKNESGHHFEKLLLKLYLIFAVAQKPSTKTRRYNKGRYPICNKNILPMWGVIAGSTHLFLLSLSLMFHRIGIYFFYALFLSNVWLVLVFLVQSGVNTSLEETSE